MAYKLRAGKTFAHLYDDVPISTAYAIIDDVTINKKDRSAQLALMIYTSRAARASGKMPLQSFSFTVYGSDFTTYFSPTLTTSIWAQAQAYLVNVGLLTTPLSVADWQLDPQAEP